MVRTKRWLILALIVVSTLGMMDLAWAKTIRIQKTGFRCGEDPRCHNRWHPAIKHVATADPGDILIYETRDAVDHTFSMSSTAADVAAANLNLVHPLTGPIFINGAERGDVLAITLIDIDPDPFGFTVIVPGFGFLRDVFPNPYIVRWNLNRLEATSPDMPGVRIPFNGFMGTIGVAPGPEETEVMYQREEALRKAGGFVLPPEPKDAMPKDVCGPMGTHKDRCLRTIPPRENGGNMDIKQMQKGTTLLLPCFVKGCLLSIGDVHYAQGDGEVSGTAIEMDAIVTVKVEVRKGMGAFIRQPHYEGGDQLKQLEPSQFYATVGFPIKPEGKVTPYHQYLDGVRIGPLMNLSEDVTLAARDALLQMVDWLAKNKGLTKEQAYCLASVAVDLRIGNLVDVPNFAVSAILPLEIFK